MIKLDRGQIHSLERSNYSPETMSVVFVGVTNLLYLIHPPLCHRLLAAVHHQMLGNSLQEAVHVLLPKVLCQVPVCACWDLWK